MKKKIKLIVEVPEKYYEACKDAVKDGFPSQLDEAIANGIPLGECRTCKHRDPEDKKCDCGGMERQGCPFPVSDDYFCKFYKKGE